MKKHKWALINAATALVLIAATVFAVLGIQNRIKYYEETAMYRLDPDSIVLIVHEYSFNGYSGGDINKIYPSFTTDGREDIRVFTECVKAAEENNRNAYRSIDLAPHYYEFTILFKNNDSPTYTYKIYYDGPNGEVNDPFDEFFSLPSVQRKMEEMRELLR